MEAIGGTGRGRDERIGRGGWEKIGQGRRCGKCVERSKEAELKIENSINSGREGGREEVGEGNGGRGKVVGGKRERGGWEEPSHCHGDIRK